MDSTAQMNTWFESVPLYFWNTVCSIDKRLKLEENKIMNRAGYCWRCEAPCTQHCSRCGMAYYCSKRCQQQDKWRHKPDCDAAALKMQCSGCNAKQEGMLKCTNCLNSYYCNSLQRRMSEKWLGETQDFLSGGCWQNVGISWRYEGISSDQKG